MSNFNVVVIVTGVVVILLLLLLRRRLTSVKVDVRRGRIDADMKREEPLPEGGARQRGIEAAGNVTARDETGVGASQSDVKAGGDVSAFVTGPAARRIVRRSAPAPAARGPGKKTKR